MVGKYSYKRKKIRGWKRRVRALAQWKNAHIDLDLETLSSEQREYVKVWIHPFYSILNQYDLPFWYKRMIIEGLIEIHDSWKATMERFDEPYYLKLWLFEKNFMQSQVVVSFRDLLHFYDQTFDEVKEQASLPQYLRTKKTEAFNWEAGIVPNMHTETELEDLLKEGLYTDKEISVIKKSAYHIERKKGELVYHIKEDTVWIGTKK